MTPELNKPLDEHSGRTPADTAQEPRAREERRSEPRLTSSELTHLVWIDREGSRRWEEVQILDRSDDGVGFRCSRHFDVGQMLWIELDDELHRAVVRSCRNNSDIYRVGLMRIRHERRRSVREPIVGTAMVQAAGIKTPAIIRNVSSDGVQIETALRIPVSEVVRLSGSSLEFLGVTHYCRAVEDHYVTGLEVLRSAG